MIDYRSAVAMPVVQAARFHGYYETAKGKTLPVGI
jgi:hypothetical protein